MLNNDERAEYGREGVRAGDPDHNSNDTPTSAGDAIANILHYAVQTNVETVALDWDEDEQGAKFDREAWSRSEECRDFVQSIVDTAVRNLHTELSGIEA